MKLLLKQDAWNYLLILLLCLLSYYGVTSNGYALDDNYYLTQIPQEEESIFSVFQKRFDNVDYRPILVFSYALEKIFNPDMDPGFSHAVNLTLYILICVFLYHFLKKLLKDYPSLLILLILTLFILHPIHANVVNNLKSRDNLLSMLFLLISLYSLIQVDLSNKLKILFLPIAIFSFVIAIMSKLDSVGLIFLAPLTIFITQKNWKFSIGTFVVFSLALFATLSFIHHSVPITNTKGSEVLFTENPLEKYKGFSDKVSFSAITMFEYLKMVLIPDKYFFYYGYNMVPFQSISSIEAIFKIILHLCILVMSVYYFFKKYAIWAFGVLWFYASLFYCSQLYTPVAGIVADRYAFISSAGAIVSVSFLIFELSRLIANYVPKFIKTMPEKGLQYITLSVVCILSIIFIPKNISRTKNWESILSLLEADMPHLKNSYQANRIAVTHTLQEARNLSQINPNEAEKYYALSLQYSQNAERLYPNEIFILESMGMSYFGLNNTKAAETTFHKVNQLTDSSLISLQLEGDILYRKREFLKASELYFKILKTSYAIDEDDFKYVSALSLGGDLNKALIHSKNIINKLPNATKGYEMAGFSYLLSKDTVSSASYFKSAFDKGLVSNNIAGTFINYFKNKNNLKEAMVFESYLQKQP